MWRSYSAASSPARRTVRPVRAVLTAFNDAVAFPPEVLGPLESWALARLAASWAAEIGVGTPASGSAKQSFSSKYSSAQALAWRLVLSICDLSALRASLRALRSAARRIDRGVTFSAPKKGRAREGCDRIASLPEHSTRKVENVLCTCKNSAK